MSVLKEIFNYLTEIKEGKISFQNLLNKGFKDLSTKDAFLIRDSLKSIVNRYYFLSWELDKIFKVDDERTKDYLICALGQYHYVKEISDEQLLSYLNEDMSSVNDKVSVSEFYEAVVALGGSPLQISEKEYGIINKRLAINYSYPEWVVKMMGKHFGVKKVYKSIASSRKNVNLSLNCNLFLTNADKVVDGYSSLFEKGILTENTLRYIGKDKLIDLEVFKKNYVFVEDESSQLLVNKLNLEVNDTALLVADDRGTIALDMAMQMRDAGTLHIASTNIVNYNSVRNIASKFKIHSFDVFESGIDTLLTHIGSETCDKVLFIAPSSQLGLVRRKPDVLLKLRREELDSVIFNQKSQLEEVSTFVKSGGILEYAVFTYNKKESFNIISEFLEAHSEFELVEERQLFSYEAPSDGVYFAILKKN